MGSNPKKMLQRLRRRKHVRKCVSGSADRPRLAVFRSNKHIYAQIIDDDRGHTLAAASSLTPGVRAEVADMKKKEAAQAVGAAIARRALEAGVTKVVFDRSCFKYHGRVAALAEGARKAGLDF